MSLILAQVLQPLREQVAYLQTQLSSEAPDEEPSGPSAHSPGLPQAPDAQLSSVSTDNLDAESSLCFQLRSEDLQDSDYHSASSDAAVKAAVARIEACALGVLESLGGVTHSLARNLPHEVKNLPSMSVPQSRAASMSEPQSCVTSESETPGVLAGVPAAKQDGALGPPQAASLQAASSAQAHMPIAQRVAHAQRSVSRMRSTSPCANIEVNMADGHRELKSWITVESMLKQGLVQNVPGIGFVSKC